MLTKNQSLLFSEILNFKDESIGEINVTTLKPCSKFVNMEYRKLSTIIAMNKELVWIIEYFLCLFGIVEQQEQ
ncbi:unnamed protein product [Ceratitis capitata]|uniref:(Mediterranean fruit fly) hypothetical protein n=1 Tax=Ceratitis capitata TaxID=7213 RepID=A0A811UJ81_CERCA|nr:unnamed protein product [Ceratitis capitata]